MVSDNARDLIKKMLEKNPAKRITAKEAINIRGSQAGFSIRQRTNGS